MNSMITPLLTVLLVGISGSQPGSYQPAGEKIMTRWARDVSPEKVHGEYPRPTMVRDEWLNLNGLWDYAIRPKDKDQPKNYDGKILVPFCVESALSGVQKPVRPENTLWYRRSFEIPKDWSEKRLLLHFGAVDWKTMVWVNGKRVGSHQGGYDAFRFDITEALKPDGPQEIMVKVEDPTDKGYQPRGKQVLKPHGIWYTAVTGIWQTVWLEPVPEPRLRIDNLKITPDVDASKLIVEIDSKVSRSNTLNHRARICDS